jgi:hypothetical protein
VAAAGVISTETNQAVLSQGKKANSIAMFILPRPALPSNWKRDRARLGGAASDKVGDKGSNLEL